jgi:hypothetical protein
MLERGLVSAAELAALERKSIFDHSIYLGDGRSIYRLLDGYVGVVDPRLAANPDAVRRTGIRLVVDNTRRS